jgi:hypothetical protein
MILRGQMLIYKCDENGVEEEEKKSGLLSGRGKVNGWSRGGTAS